MTRSDGSAAIAHRERGPGDATIKQEHEQEDRKSQAERWLPERRKDAARCYKQQGEQSCQGDHDISQAFGQQTNGAKQVVEVVKVLQNPFQ